MPRSLPEPRKTEGLEKFNMAIVYEAPPDGLHARQFGDRLVSERAGGRELKLEMWNFQVLGISATRNAAASAAAVADVLILSMSGTHVLTPQVKEWIAMWSWLVDGGHPAVFALFAAPGAEGRAIQADLRRTVAGKGLDFFAEVSPGLI